VRLASFLCRASLASGAVLALGGCVAAVPLAHLASTSATSSVAQPCVQTTGCTNAVANLSFTDMAKRFNETMQTWTGTATDAPAGSSAQPVSKAAGQGQNQTQNQGQAAR
jgi:hypothetical protein